MNPANISRVHNTVAFLQVFWHFYTLTISQGYWGYCLKSCCSPELVQSDCDTFWCCLCYWGRWWHAASMLGARGLFCCLCIFDEQMSESIFFIDHSSWKEKGRLTTYYNAVLCKWSSSMISGHHSPVSFPSEPGWKNAVLLMLSFITFMSHRLSWEITCVPCLADSRNCLLIQPR